MHLLYTGELDNIQIDARDFDAGSSNMLVISFTANGLTAEQSITFTGEYAPSWDSNVLKTTNIFDELNAYELSMHHLN